MNGERPSFGRWALAVLLGGGVLLAVGYLLLSAFGDNISLHVDRAPLPLSGRATGFLALHDMAAKMPGVAVSEIDDSSDLVYHDDGDYVPAKDPFGLILITPSTETTSEEMKQLLDAIGPRAALIVMPKWLALPDPLNHERDVRIGAVLAGTLGRMLPKGYDATFDIDGKAHSALKSTLPAPAPAQLPPPDSPQVFSGKNWEALVTDESGKMILGAHHGDRVFLLSDPDLLNNQGIADVRAAYRAFRLLAALDPAASGRFGFDLSLHYGPGNRNLLRLMFTPPFLAVTVALFAAALLAGVAAFARFGPPRRESRAYALGKRALADNIAALTRLAGRTSSAGPAYADAMRDWVARRVRAPRGLSDNALQAYLDKLHPGTSFTRIEARLRDARTESELLRAAQDMDEWRKEVT